ncbi:MAG: DUF1844 domain-containing protein [Candidatus Omnitrophica bacterium]|nr:DUF1844 domain-containing protein [Candidatus Omnitrophota bacterium]
MNENKNSCSCGREGEPGGHSHDIEVNFTIFISGLMMEGVIALGDMEHPVTKKKEVSLTHAKFIIDTIAMLKDKTKNNLIQEEADMLESILYDLRMRFLDKSKQDKK